MSQRRRGGRILVPGEARARGGLIVPGGARRGMQTLYVPRGHETREEVVLVGTCSTCDRIFYRGEEDEWQRHVGWCARQHLPEIMAAREERKKRLAVFQEENWDPEFAAYMEKIGGRMLKEGRMELKKNEKSYE
jgi:hypothetical protein